MFPQFRKFYSVSGQLGLKWTPFVRLASLSIGMPAFEAVALAMLLPIMMFIERRGDTALMRQESQAVETMFSVLDRIGIGTTFVNLLLMAFIAVVCRQAATYVRLVETTRVQESLLRTIRHEMFMRFNAATLEFQERVKSGEFVNTVVVEARRTVLGLTMFVDFAVLVLMFAVYFSGMILISPLLTAVVVVLLGLVALALGGVMKRTVMESRQVVASNAEMLSFLNERLTAPRLIRLCNLEQSEADEFDRFVERQVETAVAIRKTASIGEVVMEPVVVGAAFVLVAYAYQVLNMPLSTISVFMFIMLRLLPMAKNFITLRQGILAGSGSLEVVEDMLGKLNRAKEDGGGTRTFRGIASDLRLDLVTFSYPGANRPALSNVSLQLRRGTLTALVGPSGGGKSTLIDMLPRIRIPSAGTVQIDGVPSSAFNLSSLRRGIAFAPQTPQMFDVTVAQHIRYGRADADDPQIKRAAQLAGAADFIARLPNGFQTRLGPAAHQLSGGQKQRLDLARVLASEAELLIFDEPTSNLDNESEALFRRALWSLREAKDKTLVVIAHRLRLVDWADQIVVLNDSRVEAVGSHEEVMKASQWYRQAYQREIETDRESRIERMKTSALT